MKPTEKKTILAKQRRNEKKSTSVLKIEDDFYIKKIHTQNVNLSSHPTFSFTYFQKKQ
jgi:hypothetical protein